jgi:hypothetical protein
MALTIAAASLFVIGHIFIEPKEKLVKREAVWFDKTFSLTTIYANKNTQT